MIISQMKPKRFKIYEYVRLNFSLKEHQEGRI